MDLFQQSQLTPFPLDEGTLSVLPQLPFHLSNAEVLARLVAETAWRAQSITLWGKQHPQPRLTAWHGEAAYTYSGLRLEPLPFTPLQLALKEAVETVCGQRFNSVLLNYYRNERDSMGMHSDDEAELGPHPAIASLSFGAERTLILRHKQTKQTLKLVLKDGTLLVMSGNTQKHWQHGINKSTRPIGPRVNLTFRFIF
ncbi:alpha-ketoglutarate-dependent dioxygenase AlkB family protein [Massilia scottii]|uniref:alpha-ketoglutarate-dependent dioxygenase AlkB family protein n=1 Tax=Massilia scottii TaxID=3057166 RepID=UPI002796A549|nr:alpha-ketoglutarate-dependent dioxygenase AlkB [Massilia sp. CCM 9029]MDQ1830068.1 alpha-ketoglutarate-dependent dioxygenase AlkB [Massilia sp. CCM 9029]